MRHSRPPVVVAHTVSYPPHRRIGADLATHALLDHLARSGWRSIAVPHAVSSGDLRPEWGAVEVQPWAQARTVRPDLVLAHLPVAVRAREHADHFGAPLVVSVHGGPPGWTCARASAVEPDLLIANSQTMAASLGRTGLPVHVLHPSVWPPGDDETGAGPTGAVGLVNAAPEKGGALLRELAELMPLQRFAVIEGGHGEQVDYSGLGNVTVLPHGTPMWRLWRLVGVLVMPSADESWGMAAVEAMQRGIPVIGSTAPGLVECLGGQQQTLPIVDATLWDERIAQTRLRWSYWSEAAKIRAAELHPAPGLIETEQRLRGLIEMRDETESTEAEAPTMVTYRNVRTDQTAEVVEGSYMAERLEARPEVWERVEIEPLILPGRPASDAPKAEWVVYAVVSGADEDAAKKATKADLIALYGGAED